MQTFLPYSDFRASARVLDSKRLGKQRIETLQILDALTYDTGWMNHPATRMWRGYEHHLVRYGLACVTEWVGRGFKDNTRLNYLVHLNNYREQPVERVPPWLGIGVIHQSHRGNLFRKDPHHYARFAGDGPMDGYVWPELDRSGELVRLVHVVDGERHIIDSGLEINP